jgi:hypothetical protein
MVLTSSLYATICSQGGDVLAKRVEAQESQVAEVDGLHRMIMVFLTKEQASRMTIGTTYLIATGGIKSKPRLYNLILSEDERLPLRRYTFRADATI